MKQILSGAGAAAIILLILWAAYRCEMAVIDRFVMLDRKECDAEHGTTEKELQVEINRKGAAIEAAVYLVIRAPEKLTENSLTVCVQPPVRTGEARHEPWLRDRSRNFCGDGEYTVTFPVAYDSYGRATIGTPAVK